MTDTETRVKPPYLGLLNAISLAETAAGEALEAWAAATSDACLSDVLRLVAARERSHGDVFGRRIAELGFSVRRKVDPKAAERVARYGDRRLSDLDKLPPGARGDVDVFADIRRRLAEGEFDPMTAHLMNWYIAEERDSERRLAEAYDAVRGAVRRGPPAPPQGSAEAEAIMACMTAGFARLEKAIEKLAKARK